MDNLIRLLNLDDLPYLEAMDTGIEDDYVKKIFNNLVDGSSRLYGLFREGKLASIGGYSVFAKRYAMLGRMRSDRRYRGNDFSTQLMAYVMEEAFKLPDVQWVGANTQEENGPARRVLEKLGLAGYPSLFGAIAKDVSSLEKNASLWQEVQDLERKKDWMDRVFVKAGAVFPYECYYTFPASEALFSDDELKKWSFYENETATRVLITKMDTKKHHYLHAVYPWNDLMEQQGLWETIAAAHRKLTQDTTGETYIWMDLTEEQKDSLPAHHHFELPSPWILYGTERKQQNN